MCNGLGGNVGEWVREVGAECNCGNDSGVEGLDSWLLLVEERLLLGVTHDLNEFRFTMRTGEAALRPMPSMLATVTEDEVAVDSSGVRH